jgi:hypothetical protein
MDSYNGLTPAVSIYYENLSGKKSSESSLGSRKAPNGSLWKLGLSLLRKERVLIKNRFRNPSPQANRSQSQFWLPI